MCFFLSLLSNLELLLAAHRVDAIKSAIGIWFVKLCIRRLWFLTFHFGIKRWRIAVVLFGGGGDKKEKSLAHARDGASAPPTRRLPQNPEFINKHSKWLARKQRSALASVLVFSSSDETNFTWIIHDEIEIQWASSLRSRTNRASKWDFVGIRSASAGRRAAVACDPLRSAP